MKTARISSVPGTWEMNGIVSGGQPPPEMLDASETAIDAYAQKILEKHAIARNQPLPDESLGPYVASVLRHANGDLSQLSDYEGLKELLQEHCGLESASDLHDILEEIATSVRYCQVPVAPVTAPGDFYNYSELPHVSLQAHDAIQAQERQKIRPDDEKEFPSLSAATAVPAATTPEPSVISPNQADSLLPQHLLDEDGNGDVDSPLHSPQRLANEQGVLQRFAATEENVFVDHHEKNFEAAGPFPSTEHYENAANILLSMFMELSFEAAHAAVVLAQADVSIAQMVVHTAMTAPPICRHLLQAGCYRSDCQFSHNISTHTCIFWIRGRCGKGDACQFLHGFHESLLPHQAPAYTQHEAPYYELYGYNAPPAWPPASNSTPLYEQTRTATRVRSFANIAGKGYSSSSSYVNGTNTIRGPREPMVFSASSIPTAKIPQNLWNAHENRDAAAFHIEDPLERYRLVMSTTYHHHNVIDLHFQSTKTFQIVLEEVLPQRLEELNQVWIVTGTGHHVGSRTHQKGGGALESAVLEWLFLNGYTVFRGKDKNGQGGAVLVKRQSW